MTTSNAFFPHGKLVCPVQMIQSFLRQFIVSLQMKTMRHLKPHQFFSDLFYRMRCEESQVVLRDIPATADIATVRARASTICSYNMSELVEYNSGLPEPQEFEYLSGYCFSAMYALELLSTGYGFPETDTPITVVEDVNGTEVSWALGSIIYQANALSWTLEPPDDNGGASQDSCVSRCVGVSLYVVRVCTTLRRCKQTTEPFHVARIHVPYPRAYHPRTLAHADTHPQENLRRHSWSAQCGRWVRPRRMRLLSLFATEAATSVHISQKG